MKRRISDRKEIGVIGFSELTSLSSYSVIAQEGAIIDASTTGILLEVKRVDIKQSDLRKNLNLASVVGQEVAIFLPEMSLDLDGFIVRADHVGKGVFHVAMEFSQDIPEYWRECLIELMPTHEEFGEVV